MEYLIQRIYQKWSLLWSFTRKSRIWSRTFETRCNEISGEICKLSINNANLDGTFLHFVNNKKNSVNESILKRLLCIYFNLNLWGLVSKFSLMISTTYTYPFKTILRTLCGEVQITLCESLVIDWEFIDRIINVSKLNTQNSGCITWKNTFPNYFLSKKIT